MTEVLSVRVKKSLKDEAERLGVNLKVAVETLLEDLVAVVIVGKKVLQVSSG